MSLYLKDKPISFSLIAGLVINFALWLLLYFRIPIQIEPIVLRFNIYVGINLIGPWHNAFYFPLIGLLIIILNFILARLIFKKDRLSAHFLMTTALMAQIILLIFGGLIVMMNA